MRRDAEFEPEGVARVHIHHLAGRRITNVEVNELLEEVRDDTEVLADLDDHLRLAVPANV